MKGKEKDGGSNSSGKKKTAVPHRWAELAAQTSCASRLEGSCA